MIKTIKMIFLVILFFSMSTLSALAIEKGGNVPNIFGKTLNGKLFLLYSAKKTPRLITFFSIICKPCKKELPEMAKLEKKYPKVAFVSVHADDYSNKKVKTFVDKLSDAPETIVCSSKAVKREYGFRGFPYSVMVDENGVVIDQFIGYNHANMQRLEKLLATY